ncbi:hypothetical protein BAG01nite_19500 [Brevibacillus agri]|uniref:Uncharacterized protein n=1 Tax=Brevibacillus agri TaxID=51101 RepID=A0A3M8AWH0_9BACL|nr:MULTISPECIES: hypothetical protein [Brevibacillus]ELK41245.1 hypothetical protein D478_15045 [Brevibacillus agri BAB-2500]EJL47475.1 hypothetical protein PMI08_00428 [Brevibacillus sp. CF112]MBG9566857.1 hypothetical protein [Brevibacillus agri]MBY0052212.1 hypothetical protein [Brevibacillus agri]MCG5254241.1 hypothetical protein [Brevibacillus agri]
MQMKWRIVFIAVFIALAGGISYYSFFYQEHFMRTAEGVFLSDEYEEKYKQVVREITVNKTRFDTLLIEHEINLDGGSLTFELFDPNNRLVQSGEVTKDQIYAEKLEVTPIKGKWRVQYHTNKDTNGKYMLSLESVE